jgi:flagellar protein FlaG
MVAITQMTHSMTSPVASSPSVDVRQASPAPQQVAQMPQPAPKEQPKEQKAVTEQDVKQAVEQANREMKNLGPTETIGFGYIEKLNQIFVQVKDSKSGEVIREIPSKDFIAHKLAMQEMIGLILDKKA